MTPSVSQTSLIMTVPFVSGLLPDAAPAGDLMQPVLTRSRARKKNMWKRGKDRESGANSLHEIDVHSGNIAHAVHGNHIKSAACPFIPTPDGWKREKQFSLLSIEIALRCKEMRGKREAPKLSTTRTCAACKIEEGSASCEESGM